MKHLISLVDTYKNKTQKEYNSQIGTVKQGVLEDSNPIYLNTHKIPQKDATIYFLKGEKKRNERTKHNKTS